MGGVRASNIDKRGNMKKVNVGIIGFGTVGSGVAEVLSKRASMLKEKSGVSICIKKICDKDLRSRRSVKVKKTVLTRDVNAILKDPGIDIVVELIGGIHPAKELILKALKEGKDVVTANKALLAEEGDDIFRAAKKYGRRIRFEAGVGSSIPIVKALKENIVPNKISAIYGIVNGTSNYILWQMAEKGCSFKDALKEAKSKGFAESNPRLDINGTDSAHKLALLTLLGFGKNVPLSKIYREGITKIQPGDILYAKELGYSIKLLAIAKLSNGELELRVQPTLLASDHPLSNVRSIFNAIYVKGDLQGESLFYGKGAGKYPTASAVIADIIDLAKTADCTAQEHLAFKSGIKKVKPIENVKSKYYVRFSAIDRPGVLASIAGVLAKYRISIASVAQVERRSLMAVPIVMMTHVVEGKNMKKALTEIDRFSSIKDKSVAIRVESV